MKKYSASAGQVIIDSIRIRNSPDLNTRFGAKFKFIVALVVEFCAECGTEFEFNTKFYAEFEFAEFIDKFEFVSELTLNLEANLAPFAEFEIGTEFGTEFIFIPKFFAKFRTSPT